MSVHSYSYCISVLQNPTSTPVTVTMNRVEISSLHVSQNIPRWAKRSLVSIFFRGTNWNTSISTTPGAWPAGEIIKPVLLRTLSDQPVRAGHSRQLSRQCGNRVKSTTWQQWVRKLAVKFASWQQCLSDRDLFPLLTFRQPSVHKGEGVDECHSSNCWVLLTKLCEFHKWNGDYIVIVGLLLDFNTQKEAQAIYKYKF